MPECQQLPKAEALGWQEGRQDVTPLLQSLSPAGNLHHCLHPGAIRARERVNGGRPGPMSRRIERSLHYAENRLFRHVPIQDRLAICAKVNWVPAFLRSIATASDRRRDDVAGGEMAPAALEVALGPDLPDAC